MLLFLLGTTSKIFSIPLVDDLINEGNETFTITLSNLSNAVFTGVVTRISKAATIVDNELPILNLTTEVFEWLRMLDQMVLR